MTDAPESGIAQTGCRPQRFLPDPASHDVGPRGVEFVQARLELRGRHVDRAVQHAEDGLVRFAHVQQSGIRERIVEPARVSISSRSCGSSSRSSLASRIDGAAPQSAQDGSRIEPDLAHVRAEALVDQQHPAEQWLTDAEHELERFVRLPGADDAGQHPEHAALGAGRHAAGRRRRREEAAIARPALRVEDADLAVEPEDRRVDVGLAFERAGVVDQVAGRKPVRTVEDQVVRAHEFAHVVLTGADRIWDRRSSRD